MGVKTIIGIYGSKLNRRNFSEDNKYHMLTISFIWSDDGSREGEMEGEKIASLLGSSDKEGEQREKREKKERENWAWNEMELWRLLANELMGIIHPINDAIYINSRPRQIYHTR